MGSVEDTSPASLPLQTGSNMAPDNAPSGPAASDLAPPVQSPSPAVTTVTTNASTAGDETVPPTSSSSSCRLPSLAALSAVSRRPPSLKDLKAALPSLIMLRPRTETTNNNNNTDTAPDPADLFSADEPQVEVRGPQPSCQLFNMFKALAAGAGTLGGSALDNLEEVDTDSDSVDDETAPAPRSVTPRADQARATDKDDDLSVSEVSSAPTPHGIDTPEDGSVQHTVLPEGGGNRDDADAVKRWLQDTIDRNEQIGNRFAAASMSNFSPFGEQEMLENSQPLPGARRRKSSIHHLLTNLPVTEEPENADSSSSDDEWYPADDHRAVSDDTSGTPSIAPIDERPPLDRLLSISADADAKRFRHDDIPEDQKLSIIVNEFGDMASKMMNRDGTEATPERILAESQGSLFKGVMMIGNLHLTNYRLTFHALLPPDDAFNVPRVMPDQTEAQADARHARPDIIQAGPVTLHRRSGPMKSRKRVWMELSPDMLTTYPSADEAGRVRPLFSILLSTALRLAPYDVTHPRDFYLTYDTIEGERTTHFSIDNEQSAMVWRRQFEGALFRYARDRFREAHQRDNIKAGFEDERSVSGSEWTLLRCCVPLDTATLKGVGDYHSFATLINLDVSLDHTTHVTWHPEEPADGNFSSYGKYSDAGRMLEDKNGKDRSPSGSSTPRRSLSLRQALPSFRRRERESSPRRSPLVPHSGPPSINTDRADSASMERSSSSEELPSPQRSTTWVDSALPPRLSGLSGHKRSTSIPGTPEERTLLGFDVANSFEFLVAVLNEQAWFATALEGAMVEAQKRVYRPDETHAKMTLDVGGYDCLVMDDDEEAQPGDDSSSSEPEHVYDDDDESSLNKPRAVSETRKAEKAHQAARVFGLREDEGIWLKRCYVAHGLVPARGHLIVNPRFICFWRRATVGSDIKYRWSTSDLKRAEKAPPIRLGWHGMVLKIHGHRDQRFDFWLAKGRDETIERINELLVRVDGRADGAPTVRQDTTDSLATAATTSTVATTDSTASAADSASLVEATGSSTSPTNVSLTTAEHMWNTAKNLPSPTITVNPAILKAGTGSTLRQAAEVLAPPPDMLVYPKALSEDAIAYMPFVANRPWTSHSYNVRLTSRRFAMLTIGSRGDVQPYIALSLRLMEDGHKCVIITHGEFKEWVESYGIEHREAGGDPTALMKLSTEHRMFSPAFFKDALGTFRQWLDDLLLEAWKASQDADVLIESPSAMAGIHIAEALKIPYFRAFTMPWTRTAAYPQAFMVPAFDMGPSFNYSTYVLFDNIMWRASAGQINRWRKKYLGLGATDQTSLSVSKVPFLYNFSPAVVPKPLDWYDDITITGYWNLENSDMEWTPPASLVTFMEQAKLDGKPLVYIGFGSIVVPDPKAMTKSIIKAVQKADVRAIIAKGWSARDSKPGEEDVELPPETCYGVDKVPHGWLFPKINAALHHGGAGTTGASLRAGLPTLIKPWFGDQNFWAIRVTKLEVGMKVASLRSDDIADALRKATTSTVMIEKAARIGERIRSENGVNAAVSAIHANLIRAAQNRQALKREDAHRRRKVSQDEEQDSEDAAATLKKADKAASQGSGSSFSLPPLPKVTLPTLGCK